MPVLINILWAALAGIAIHAAPDVGSAIKSHVPSVRAGNWDKEMAADWDSMRNMRPCVGARDPSCKYQGGK